TGTIPSHSGYFRPAEVELFGDPNKIKWELGWELKVKFGELLKMMMDADMGSQEQEKYLQYGGYSVKHYFE
ncbi:MAG: GDP-mannose 4,6-dehydratase, partial [Spirochaeta sp.]|nr:GDP-mannose 4,6-dehydratase [Spirochaeta sp.]